MKVQGCQLHFKMINVVLIARSIASIVENGSSKLPRQEQNSQFIRRSYYGCSGNDVNQALNSASFHYRQYPIY